MSPIKSVLVIFSALSIAGCGYPPDVQAEYERCLHAARDNPLMDRNYCKNIAEMHLIRKRERKVMASYCGKKNVSIGERLIWTDATGERVYHQRGFFYDCRTGSEVY